MPNPALESIVSILKRILGLFQRESSPSTTQLPPKASVAIRPAPRTVAISWQEMLDDGARISGYILRPAPLPPVTEISGPALLDALDKERVDHLAAHRKVIIPLRPAQWSAGDFRSFASPNVCFQLSAKDFPPSPEAGWQETARGIRAMGGSVAVDLDIFLSSNDAPALTNHLLLGIQGASLAAFEKTLRAIREQHPTLVIIVHGVSSWSEYRLLIAQGVSFCVGQFSTSPDDAVQAEQISQSRLVIIDMLNSLRHEGDVANLASIAKRDPAVVLKLLEMTNSPLSGLSRRVSNIEDSLLLLGHDALYRWLSLAMFRIDARKQRDEGLMIIAASRAAFLESLADTSNREMAGELFLVGLLSLIDSLLSMPMEKILLKMHLPERVAAVLLKNEGPYARYLLLAFAMERCQIDQALSLCTLIGIDAQTMLGSYGESMAWASAR